MRKHFNFWSSPLTNYGLQFIFIFSSVYFAFWLTDRKEYRKQKAEEVQAIRAIYLELGDNAAQMEKAMPYHEVLRKRLQAFSDSISRKQVDITGRRADKLLMRFVSGPNGFLRIPNLSNTAWLTLQNSQAYGMLDYETASMLSRVYQWQELGVTTTSKHLAINIFQSRDLFQPAATEAILNQCYWTFRELTGQEYFLINQIRDTMSALKEKYPWLKTDHENQTDSLNQTGLAQPAASD